MAQKKNGEGSAGGRKVLTDHVRRGKKFTPPLMEVIKQSGGDARIEWLRWGLPELVWMAVVMEDLGPQRACSLFIEAMRAARKAAGEPQGKAFMLASDYSEMCEDGRRALFDSSTFARIRPSLAKIAKFYPTFPMAWLAGERAIKEASGDLDELRGLGRVVKENMSRRERPAMVLQTAAVVGAAASGALKLHHLDDPNLIILYPNTGESRRLAASVRALMDFELRRATDSAWSREFWRQGRRISPCDYPTIEEPDPPTFDELAAANAVGTAFARSVFSEVRNLFEQVAPDLDCPSRPEVLFGLLQRQAQIAADLARLPPMWVSPWGQMANRAMAETLIRLKWLAARNRAEEFEWFVDYGLGQEKLYVEHLGRLVEQDHPESTTIEEERQWRIAWLDEQRYTFLQEVDVGGGAHKIDLRKMAEEAGCPDLRSLVFQPLSSTVHGHWNAIGRQNMHRCMNPLHGSHYLPVEFPRPLDIRVAVDAVGFYAASYKAVAVLLGAASTESDAALAWLDQGDREGEPVDAEE